MAPLRGWGPKGQRPAVKVPHGHWQTLTLIAALRHDRVDAPCVIDGPINGMLFTAYVEQFLAPIHAASCRTGSQRTFDSRSGGGLPDVQRHAR